MKCRGLLSLGLAALCLVILGAANSANGQGRGQGFRPCPYTPYHCPIGKVCKPGTFSGKVGRVLTETLDEGMYPGMAIILDTKSDGQVHVHLGPVWFLERQDFVLQPGDEVSVKGLCEKSDGKMRVIASELTKGDYILQLRDETGRPYWEAWRKR